MSDEPEAGPSGEIPEEEDFEIPDGDDPAPGNGEEEEPGNEGFNNTG